MNRLERLLLSFALVLAVPVAAQEPTLRWKSLNIRAYLDAYAGLQIREEHVVQLDGSWEVVARRFPPTVASRAFEQKFRYDGDRVRLHKLTLIDPLSGRHTPLAATVSKLNGDDVVRWSIRRADDPPFAAKQISYVLEYTLMFTLDDGDRYLRHDFLPLDRKVPIEHFTLTVELEPFWKTTEPLKRIERDNVQPDETLAIVLPLQFSGLNAADPTPTPFFTPDPVAARSQEPSPARDTTEIFSVPTIAETRDARAVAIALGLATVALAMLFLNAERRRGRFSGFEKPPPYSGSGWIARHLLAPYLGGADAEKLARQIADGHAAAMVTRSSQLRVVRSERPHHAEVFPVTLPAVAATKVARMLGIAALFLWIASFSFWFAGGFQGGAAQMNIGFGFFFLAGLVFAIGRLVSRLFREKLYPRYAVMGVVAAASLGCAAGMALLLQNVAAVSSYAAVSIALLALASFAGTLHSAGTTMPQAMMPKLMIASAASATLNDALQSKNKMAAAGGLRSYRGLLPIALSLVTLFLLWFSGSTYIDRRLHREGVVVNARVISSSLEPRRSGDSDRQLKITYEYDANGTRHTASMWSAPTPDLYVRYPVGETFPLTYAASDPSVQRPGLVPSDIFIPVACTTVVAVVATAVSFWLLWVIPSRRRRLKISSV